MCCRQSFRRSQFSQSRTNLASAVLPCAITRQNRNASRMLNEPRLQPLTALPLASTDTCFDVLCHCASACTVFPTRDTSSFRYSLREIARLRALTCVSLQTLIYQTSLLRERNTHDRLQRAASLSNDQCANKYRTSSPGVISGCHHSSISGVHYSFLQQN